ncbi:PEGA domain-containing protein [bacterium]|nr:PEGA domain-containing protein [bacterium]
MEFDKPNSRKGLALVSLLCGCALLLVACGREAPVYAPGSLTVTSDPAGAAILFDGRPTGEVTPHTFTGLAPDLYRVSVALAGYLSAPASDEIDLAAGQTRDVAFALSQTALHVTSDPAGAAVLLDGDDTGLVTPATLVGVAEGPHQIALRLDTYLVAPLATTVDVVAGRTDTLAADTFALRPQRTVILEGFGNVDCGPCPQLTEALLALADRPDLSPDRMLYIEYSTSFPGPGDPLYLANAAENADRFELYFFFNLPILYVDGVATADYADVDGIAAEVASGLAIDPGFRIDVAADFTATTIPVDVTLDPAADVDLSGHVLFVALYEKEIDFAERGLTVGSNGQSVFHHVFRDRVDVPPALGSLTAGTPQTFRVELVRGDWPLDNLTVVAFVQRNSDLAILQAGSFGESTSSKGIDP